MSERNMGSNYCPPCEGPCMDSNRAQLGREIMRNVRPEVTGASVYSVPSLVRPEVPSSSVNRAQFGLLGEERRQDL